jgi:predicted metal-dependent HD superfamily phosphohydrolase
MEKAMETELVKKARSYAEEIFGNAVFEKLPYHNLEHTMEVVDAAKIIGQQSGLNEDEMESALLAAWLHDIGYLNGDKDHELVAATKSKELLSSWGSSYKTMMEVSEAIKSTKMPQQPESLVSKVVCDADLFHLSTEQHLEHGQRLREEWRQTRGQEISDNEWLRSSLEFMQQHRYHTPYGRTVLEQEKKRNIKKLKKLLDPEKKEKKYKELQEEVVKLKSKLEKEKGMKPDRGIETMFRTTSHNHILLSSMADNKSNILITINSIILSVVVSVLVRKLEDNEYLIIPTVLLVTVCLSTMVFAILATRPNISRGKFNREDIKNKRTNLLFFGNFHGMEIENYEWAMKEMMRDADYLYGSLIKDIYYLGKVLGKKYKYLRLSYNIFMYGFVVAILSFVIAMLTQDL